MTYHIDSASDNRTENNAVRHTYRVLSDAEKHGMTWEQWRDQLEAHHANLRATVPGFDGYGEQVMQTTGEDCWKEYFEEGFSPKEALEFDMSYWEE